MGASSGVSCGIVLTILVLDVIAFGLAIGAESRRSHAIVETDVSSGYNYCTYTKDVATGLGVGAFFFLLLGQLVVAGLTKCMCCSTPLKPGGSRAAAITFFILSWVTFVIAELCLIGGSSKAAYHTKTKLYEGANDLSCETLRKGIFSAAAAFTFFTMLLSEGYYYYFVKAQQNSWQAYNTGSGAPTVGMAAYPPSY